MPTLPFAPWHDFYALIGTAAATLVGLMFVAASVGTSVFTEERQEGLRTFLSPTVVAFGVVLAISLIGVLPVLDWRVPAGLLLGIGGLGLVYSWRVWHRMRGGGMLAKIDREDRAWYIVAPALGYLILVIAGATLHARGDAACVLLAAGACVLLLAGLRNAWDMTTWAVLRRRN